MPEAWRAPAATQGFSARVVPYPLGRQCSFGYVPHELAGRVLSLAGSV